MLIEYILLDFDGVNMVLLRFNWFWDILGNKSCVWCYYVNECYNG